MSNLRIGQKVAVVRDWSPVIRAQADQDGIELPVTGVVYTVRGIETIGKIECLYVVEVVNPILRYICGTIAEQGFDPDRFRPIQTKKTDISIFKAMLTPSKKRVEA